ncbi:GGDEF domain-containing protein [Shewanella gelidii]|uniref:diguanylate cyclase n=1 Tax=Shewanella gelidii TaxID=1642821 RepID=A0A917JT37_9GAMM|nr:GGDEF domain-containing protein [Shewanella gelidii]MCL1098202.1 GGDEF domain-containing protein [Shewanella gelidii]GGI83363.1 hypothetical protein GCM10009332_20810 [Shewanella gelidii]
MHPLLSKCQSVVDRLIEKSNCKTTHDALRLNHYVWLALISIPLSIIFIIKNFFAGNYSIAAVVVMLMGSMIASLFFITKVKRPSMVYHATNCLFLVMLVLVSIWGDKSEGQILWSYMYPVLSIFLFGNRLGVQWSVLLLVALLVSLVMNGNIDLAQSIEFEIRFSIIYLTILSVTSWLEYYRNRYTDEAIRQRKTLEKERENLEQEIDRRIQLETKLKRLANHDSLTELYNRRHFLSRATEEIHRAQRHDLPATMALIDIDKFKEVNDTYGHPIGDAVLKSFAKLCKQSLRQTDIAGRIGGEEFAILLLHAPAEHARLAMDRFRQQVSEYPFQFEGLQLNITISIGLSAIDDNTVNVDQLYAAADSALYRAKDTGRNRVEIGRGPIQK